MANISCGARNEEECERKKKERVCPGQAFNECINSIDVDFSHIPGPSGNLRNFRKGYMFNPRV